MIIGEGEVRTSENRVQLNNNDNDSGPKSAKRETPSVQAEALAPGLPSPSLDNREESQVEPMETHIQGTCDT